MSGTAARPTLGNWAPHAGNGASNADVIQLGRSQTPAVGADLARPRTLPPARSRAPLVVKGILNPADAIRAAEIGVDGIIVSNHGGRQLDQAPASLDALPAIKAAVGDKLTVMLDSGVRRGADILIALCLGAQFVFFGRPTLYGAVAGGLPGVKKAVDIFRARSTSSWARSAARASTSSAPISCGATTGPATADRRFSPSPKKKSTPLLPLLSPVKTAAVSLRRPSTTRPRPLLKTKSRRPSRGGNALRDARGLFSSASISSIVRPRVSIAMNAKASAPSTYQEAK